MWFSDWLGNEVWRASDKLFSRQVHKNKPRLNMVYPICHNKDNFYAWILYHRYILQLDTCKELWKYFYHKCRFDFGNLWFRWEMMHLSQHLPIRLVNICNYPSIRRLCETKEEYNTVFAAIWSYQPMKKQSKTLKLFKRSLK